MKSISPSQLLDQLIGQVGLLAAPSHVQEDWARKSQFPAEELALRLYDSVPGWIPRLREAGVLSEAGARCLQNLRDYVESVQPGLFEDGPCVSSAPEWETVRRLATETLATVRPAS
jgi:hypothetical protein